MAGEEVPPYPIIKDLFDFCDKNKNNKITIEEWMDVFTICKYETKVTVPKNSMRPSTSVNQKKSMVLSGSAQNFPPQAQLLVRPQTAAQQGVIKRVNFNSN